MIILYFIYNIFLSVSPVSNSMALISPEGDQQKVKEIEMLKTYPQKEFCLQDIADIEYIPFETRSDVLLDIGALLHLCVNEEFIVTYNRDGTVFVFKRDGKIFKYFNHLGRSGEEYNAISKMTVDFNRQEIFIYSHPLQYHFLVYDFDGNFKRKLRLPNKIWVDVCYNYDADYLLCYDAYVKYASQEELNERPYFLINKQTGEIVKLSLVLNSHLNNSFMKTIQISGNFSRMVGKDVNSSPLIKNGCEFLIADYICDTIYSVQGTSLSPFLIKKPSVCDMEPPLLLWPFLKTNRYTFMCSVFKKIDKNGHFIPGNFFVYDQKAGDIFTPYFTNKDYATKKEVALESINTELPPNYARFPLLPLRLIEDYKKGNLSGPLKDIASGLDEEDNGVLMLVKFKE